MIKVILNILMIAVFLFISIAILPMIIVKLRENLSEKNFLDLIVLIFIIYGIFMEDYIGYILFGIIYFFFSLIIFPYKKRKKVGNYKLYFKKRTRKIPKKVSYYREIPFNDNIFKAFWICECYRLNKNKTDFLGAILLKWLFEGKIENINLEVNSKNNIKLFKDQKFDNIFEKELYDIMCNISDSDVLDKNKFENWCFNNKKIVINWFNKILDDETQKLINEDIIKIKQGLLSKIFKSKKYIVDPSMKEEAIKLKGFKLFLEDLVSIDYKRDIEVKLWEYYLIYAQILGIADKISKDNSKIYSDIALNIEFFSNIDEILGIK